MAAAVAATAVVMVMIAAMVVVATAPTSVCGLYFLRSGIADCEDFAVETHRLTGQRMVEIHLHFTV